MTVATGNFPELLWPGIKKLFGDEYKDYMPMYSKVFKQERSDKAFEKDQGVTRLGLAGVKEQGGPITYVDPVQGYQKEYAHVEYALGTSITNVMYEDDQYRYINGAPRWLKRSMIQTKEIVHSNVLNNAFTTELVADGLSLINAAHVNVATGTTQRNQPATAADLTQTSLEQAYIDIADWTDDQDIKIQCKPVGLLVPNELRWTAMKIVRTTGEVGTDANTMNPMNGKFDPMVWEYLTDPDAWFVLTDCNDAGLTTYNRRGLSLDRDNEFDTKSLKFSADERYSLGATDWRCIYGSAGA